MITDFETHVGSAPDGWDEVVCRLGGPVFHSTLWAEYQRKTKNVQPMFLLARDENGNECAGAVAFFLQSHRPFASWVFRKLQLPAHPFVRDHDGAVAAQIVQRCEELARTLKCSRITIDSFMSGRSAFVPSEYGYMESQRLEFSLDLSRDMDSLWKGIRKDQRERIRRLERMGVTVEIGTTEEDLQGLRLAREATQTKRSGQGQGYQLSSDDGFYEGIYEHLLNRGAARLFVARHSGQVVAALFFVIFNGKAYSVFSGSTDQGYKLGTQCGLFWTAVETFKADGFQELNRGGVSASAASESDPLHGIYLFKVRLGTTPLMCRSGQKVLSPLRDRLSRLRKRLWS